VLGLGGIGSLVAEYLARLGVANLTLVDTDTVERTNLCRLVGATVEDAERHTLKVDVAERVIRQAYPEAQVTKLVADVAAPSVVEHLKSVDYIFLAADSMRARLVVNALTQQFFVSGVQLGSKIVVDEVTGRVDDAMSVVRPMRPGNGCLHCSGFINRQKLALEFATEEDRQHANYGTEDPNPSVITLNAVAASTAVNDFLFDVLELRPDDPVRYRHMSHVRRNRGQSVELRDDQQCPECGVKS